MYGDHLSVHHFLVEFLINRQLRKGGGTRELKFYLFKKDEEEGIHLSLSTSGDPIAASLESGGWSPAIEYMLNSHPHFFKVKHLYSTANGVVIYVSPLFRPLFGSETPYTFPLTPEELPVACPPHYVVEGPGLVGLENEHVTQALWELARDISALRAGYIEDLFHHGSWDLFAAVYTLTDRVQHAFWKFREPKLFRGVPVRLVDQFGGVIDRAYMQIDRNIGRLLRGLREDDLVVILSDHGFQARRSPLVGNDTMSGVHNREGVFIFYGRNVKRAGSSATEFRLQADLLQVAPTVLYLSGLQVGEDMEGGILTSVVDDAYLRDHPVRWIRTYNSTGKEAKAAREIGESTKEQLKSLGYVQ
jgi:hypothetical protein